MGRFSQNSEGSTAVHLLWYYEKVVQMLYKRIAHRKSENSNKIEPICIEQMSFKKPLGPNGTVITMVVSGKAGRETNPPGLEILMHLFDNLAKIVDFVSHCGAHWILKGVPKSSKK